MRPAIELLSAARTPFGFVATPDAVANYRRVWARDGVITGLAALLYPEEPALTATFRETLVTLYGHQHAAGFFPSNVDPATGQASYGGACGRVDNVSWAVIGLMQYAHLAPDGAGLAQALAPQVRRALAVMDAWEFNGKHLMYVPQSGDWADEYALHGYLLYDQLLRVWALELAAGWYDEPAWRAKATAIRQSIEVNFWNPAPAEPCPSVYSPALARQLADAPTGHWLAGFNPSRAYGLFDLAATAFAILLNVGSAAQQAAVLADLDARLAATPGLLPAFAPVLDARESGGVLAGLAADLAENYAYEFRNFPHEFHNGGAWPVWNGWLAAALAVRRPTAPAVAALSQRLLVANMLDSFTDSDSDSAPDSTADFASESASDSADWGFYELHHGLTQAPLGVRRCTWSAAGLLLATAASEGRFLVIP